MIKQGLNSPISGRGKKTAHTEPDGHYELEKENALKGREKKLMEKKNKFDGSPYFKV